ncbi:MAG: hypothetical protein QM778_28650 [Myxococcales bacterium]
MERAITGMLLAMGVCGSIGACAGYIPSAPGPIQTASVVDVHPDRPRYRHRPLTPGLRLHARAIELRLLDRRALVERKDSPSEPVLLEVTGEEPIEVSAHRDFDGKLREALASYVDEDPKGPLVTLFVQVERVAAWNQDQQREVGCRLSLALESEGGVRLSGASGSAVRDMSGAPYDIAELDEMHLGTCLEAFQQALSDRSIERVNEALEKSAVAPTSEQT